MLLWLACLFHRLQSVLDTAARSMALCNITDDLAIFYCLRAPERINFKLAVIVYRAVHGTAPRYLSDLLHNVADLPTKSWLRSSTSRHLDVRPSRLVTVDDRSYCWTTALELPAWRRPVCLVNDNFLPSPKTLLISAVLLRHCSVAVSPQWTLKSLYLGHYK